jgi:single-strand DNA-binding protein
MSVIVEKRISGLQKRGDIKMAERSVNKAILIGRIGLDADSRVTQSGTPVSRFSLAMNRQWMDSDKQVHEETDWIPVVIWNRENLSEYLTRGSRVYVEGRLQTRSYEDNSGVKRYITEVIAQNVVLLGDSGRNGNGSAATKDSADRPSKPGRPAGAHHNRGPEPGSEELDPVEVPF